VLPATVFHAESVVRRSSLVSEEGGLDPEMIETVGAELQAASPANSIDAKNLLEVLQAFIVTSPVST
jgi:hypothetical protein